MRGNDGAAQLTDTLSRMIRRRMRASHRNWNDLGTIQPDGSLKLDRFARPFPPGQFYKSRLLSLTTLTLTTNSVVVGDHGSHDHTVALPDEFTALQPGDRVLVDVANDGVDPVVIDVLERTA